MTDPDKGIVTKATDPSSQETVSQYDGMRRLTKTSTTLNGQEVKTESTYDQTKGWLTTVRHNTTAAASGDVAYTFGYDSLGRQTAVTVGTGANVHVLSTTAYDALVKRISDVVFGNPGNPVGSVHYTYDSFGRLTAVRYDDETAARFTYRYDATGRVGVLEDHEQHTLTYTDYDLAGRPAMKTKLRNGAHVYTGRLTYNAYELPDVFTEQVGTAREKHTTAFGYDEENRVTSLQYDGSTDEQVAYTYDALGRIVTRTVKVNGQEHTTTYTYAAGGYGTNSTTGLIETITQNGVTLTYAYDDNGNITSVSDGTKTVSYEYDAIGQLIRVNDPYDTRSGSNGTTWTFEYDLGGNILKRKRYAYTTETLPGTHLQQILYAYGDSEWKDKLTSYNGVSITSDGIGNITAYGAWTYQWRHGRELVHMSRSQYQPIEVDFEYNEEGLRTKKTITDENDVVTVTEYTLHGKNIVHMTRGTQSLHFFYDGQDRPSIVEWNNGSTTNRYAYVYNLQGDVIALVNSSGTKVVNYVYDAWGKPLSKTGTLAGTLGTLNPFRYRGYVYDEEIDFYYLRSRYYNANRGRFINADSVFDGAKLFRYCGNNPINAIDNDGTNPELGYHYEPLQYTAQVVAGGAILYRLDSDMPNCNDYFNWGYVDGGTIVQVKENVFVMDDQPEGIYNVKPEDMLLVDIDLGNGKTISGRMYRKNIDVSYSQMTAIEAFGDITICQKNFKGQKKPDRRIWNLQQYLNRKISKKINVDGYWGPNTRDAIVSFQRKYGLTVDGEAGTKTKNRLIQEVAIK